MPAYSADFTARFKVRYHAADHNHSQTWRFAGVGGEPELTAVRDFLTNWYAALAPDMWDDLALISCSVAARDSSIFLPAAPFTMATGGTDSASLTPGSVPVAASFTGRSNFGNQWKIFQYGWASLPGGGGAPNDYRITEAELTSIADANAALAVAFGVIIANDGGNVYVNPYANVKANDYWVGQVRG